MLPRRALVVVATFLLAFLLYVDRVCISTAKGPIVAELGLSDAQFGWVLSAFAFGYALLQTPSGMLADRLGARRILAAIVHSLVDLHRPHGAFVEFRFAARRSLLFRRRRGRGVSGHGACRLLVDSRARGAVS